MTTSNAQIILSRFYVTGYDYHPDDLEHENPIQRFLTHHGGYIIPHKPSEIEGWDSIDFQKVPKIWIEFDKDGNISFKFDHNMLKALQENPDIYYVVKLDADRFQKFSVREAHADPLDFDVVSMVVKDLDDIVDRLTFPRLAF